MKTLEDFEKDIPADVKAKHDAMTHAEAVKAAEDLEAEALKCDYFSNGYDAFSQASGNFTERAEYFRLLAASKDAAHADSHPA